MSDRDNDGVPDSIDIDGGDGTGKARPGVRPPYGGQQAGAPTVPGQPDLSKDQFVGDATDGNALVAVAAGMDPLTQDQAKQWFEAQFVMNTDQAQQIRKALAPLGYESDKDILYALDKGIDYAGNEYGTKGPQGEGNPFEWIFSGASGTRQPSGGGGGGGGGPFTSDQTSVNISSADKGAAMADQAFEQQMGRMATGDEGKAFTQALNLMEQQNPTRSITSGVSSGSSSTSSTKTTGGFDAAQFAKDWARSQDGYAENFAATTFMQVLDSALSRPDVVQQRLEAIQ